MFENSGLKFVRLPGYWDNVTNTSNMFKNAANFDFISIPLSWGNVTNHADMFTGTGFEFHQPGQMSMASTRVTSQSSGRFPTEGLKDDMPVKLLSL